MFIFHRLVVDGHRGKLENESFSFCLFALCIDELHYEGGGEAAALLGVSIGGVLRQVWVESRVDLSGSLYHSLDEVAVVSIFGPFIKPFQGW